jgi:hypothetical protein
MTRALLTLALIVAFSGDLLARDLELVESAYELSLGDVTMPGSTAGSVIFRPCESCDTVSLRVSSTTRYFLGDRGVALADFLAAVDELRKQSGASAQTPVTVFYGTENRQATRIRVEP